MKKKNKIVSIISFLCVLSLCCAPAQLLAQEVPVVDTSVPDAPVDFPGRSSLTEVKEAQLPSLSDSVIKDPAPMERVVTKKDLPSEQLLGRITPEVFHEMADIERGNVFLKLQAQREELKNQLEELKAKYRQARLDEIEKRENVIRTRVQWQQEQERIRQEIQEKKLQTELLEKELEEKEMAKEDLMPLDQEDDEPVAEDMTEETAEDDEIDAEENETKAKKAPKKKEVFKITKILDIKGMKGRLTARVVDSNGKKLTLKNKMELPLGYVVKDISKTDIVLEKDGETIVFNIHELNEAEAKKTEKAQEEAQQATEDIGSKEEI